MSTTQPTDASPRDARGHRNNSTFPGSRKSGFGRLFPDLPCHIEEPDVLLRQGAAGGVLECRGELHSESEDNPRIPAGWPFFGQFIAHDITHDRAPLQASEDIESIANFRTPRLDLECLYGAGPVGQPYLYDGRDPDKFLIGQNGSPTGDLPRNNQGFALVGEPRNDTHLFISQLHLAFLHFHNRTIDRLRDSGAPADEVFSQASLSMRRHYQWIVLREFLPLIVGDRLLSDVIESGPQVCRYLEGPFMPIEFSAAAFRFGHAQIRATYDVNSAFRSVPLFPHLVGTHPVTAERQIDWTFFFAFDQAVPPQLSRRICPRLVSPLMRLPEELVGKVQKPEFSSLAARDLYRGRSLALPSGEAIARCLGCELIPQSRDERALPETPLWLYVLTEAERQNGGEFLGEVGGRIVADVLVSLLMNDPESILNEPKWSPEYANASGQFGIAELLQNAGAVHVNGRPFSCDTQS